MFIFIVKIFYWYHVSFFGSSDKASHFFVHDCTWLLPLILPKWYIITSSTSTIRDKFVVDTIFAKDFMHIK